MNFYIEPYIFAISTENTDKKTFEKYINTLTQWEEFSKMEWGYIYLLSSTYDILLTNGYYPFTDKIKALIKQHNINYIGVNDVDRILNQFLVKFPKIDNELKGILCTIKHIIPKSDLSTRPDIFNNELCKLLGLITLKKNIYSDDDDNNIVFTKNLSKTIEIDYDIEYMIKDDKLETKKTSSKYSSFESFTDFCSNESTPSIIWKNAIEKKDFDIAIRIAIMQQCNYDCIMKSFESHSFYLQDTLIKCIQDLHFNNNNTKIQSTIRALKEVVLNINLSETHFLRKDSGANSPQIKKNDYAAWRKDIDYEYHLHYWAFNNTFKFANIFTHDVYMISHEL